jgi:hypothetical protein
MKISAIRLFAAAVLFSFSLGMGGTASRPVSTVPQFAALTQTAASDAANKLVADRRTLETDLLGQFDDAATPDDRRVFLIYLLGQLRSQNAATSLAKSIDFSAPFVDPKTNVGRWGPYPVVDALINIGGTAKTVALEALSTDTNELRTNLFVTVLHDIDGAKMGRISLQLYLESVKEPERRQRLEKALAAFDRLVSQLDK